MEVIKITEKAQTYARRFAPVVKNKFVEVATIDSENSTSDSIKVILKPRKQRVFSIFILALMILGMSFFGFKLLIDHNDTFGAEIMSVAESLFVPKDFGKIKFVGTDLNEFDSEAYSCVEALDIPFSACVSTKFGDQFLLTSPSEILVKCAMDGVVTSVTTDEKTFKKSVVVMHKYDIKTEYYMLDNLSVKVGDKVTKNTPLGVASSCQIGFKITYKNSIVKGLEIVNGELVFS